MKIEVQGLDRLMKNFAAASSPQKINAVVDKTLEKVAVKIKAQAQINLGDSVYSTPKTWYTRTNTLRNNRTWSTEKIPKGWEVICKSEYATHVEFGTGTLGDPSVSHTTKPYWSYKGADGKFHTSHGMKPRPFLQPAFNKYKDTVPQEIKINLSKALREAIRHG